MPKYLGKNVVRALLLLASIYFLLPIWWLVVSATKSSSQLFGSAPLWFADNFRLWDNIQAVMTQQGGLFPRWLLNTVFYAGVGALGATLISAAAG